MTDAERELSWKLAEEAIAIIRELADHTPHYWNFGWIMQGRIRKLLATWDAGEEGRRG